MGWKAVEWFRHSTSHDHHVALLSVDIQPTGERFASAGVDGRISIWPLSAVQLLPSHLEAQADSIRLAQIQVHSAPVNVVRWSANGRCLASGGDDHIIYVHELMRGQSTLVSSNGSGGHHSEVWQLTIALRGHQLSVVDIAWSPDNTSSQMCSGSLDRSVIVWDVHKGVPMQVLKGHQGFVKGVAWDPLGEYIASQSDDNSVIIWGLGTAAIEQVAKIQEPCLSISETTAFSTKISWSPDGSKLAVASKITKVQSSAFITLFINRKHNWTLVARKAHDHLKGMVTVSKFNPKLFHWNGKSVHYCGCGSSKGVFSILREPCGPPSDPPFQSHSHPSDWIGVAWEFLVTQENITDASWAPDGFMMLMVSNKGTLYRGMFEKDSLGTPVSANVNMELQCGTSSNTPTLSCRTGEPLDRITPDKVGSGSEGKKRKRKIKPVRADGPSIQKTMQFVPDRPTIVLDGSPDRNKKITQNAQHMPSSVEDPDMFRVFRTPHVQSSFSFASEDDEEGGITEVCVTNPDATNGSDGMVSKVELLRDSKVVLWEADVDGTIVLGAGNKSFIAVATSALTLQTFKRTGWRVLHPLYLTAEAAYLKLQDESVLIVGMTNGDVRVWDLSTEDLISQTTLHPHMLSVSVHSIDVSLDGFPIVTLENGWTHMYNGKMCAWVLASKNKETSEYIKKIVIKDSREDSSSNVMDVPDHMIQDCLAACLTVGEIDQYKILAEKYVRNLMAQFDNRGRGSIIFSFCMYVGELSYVGLREFVVDVLVKQILALDFSLEWVKNKLIEELSDGILPDK